MQVKPLVIYTTLPLGRPKSGALTTPRINKDIEKQEFSFIFSRNAQLHNHFGRQFGSFLENSAHVIHHGFFYRKFISTQRYL